ncbi:MAG: substrate-binding domain-containing protein, partial [Lachnospiraceae bacterium]
TGIMKAAIRLGLRIPEDVAVVGYDDSRVCSAVEPELTSVHIYRHEMGRQAAELMLQILRGELPHRQKIVVDPTLHIRASS